MIWKACNLKPQETKFPSIHKQKHRRAKLLISSPAKAIHIQVQHDLEIQNKQKNSHIHIHNSIKPWRKPTTWKYSQTAKPTKTAGIFKTKKPSIHVKKTTKAKIQLPSALGMWNTTESKKFKLQRKRFLNNNNPELGSESENTSKQKKSSKFRRGRKDRSPHEQTSSAFMELIFSMNHQNRHSQAPKKNTHTHKSTPFGQIFRKKEHLTEFIFGRKYFTKWQNSPQEKHWFSVLFYVWNRNPNWEFWKNVFWKKN